MTERVIVLKRFRNGEMHYRCYWNDADDRIFCVPGRKPLDRHPQRIWFGVDFGSIERHYEFLLREAGWRGWQEVSALELLAEAAGD